MDVSSREECQELFCVAVGLGGRHGSGIPDLVFPSALEFTL
jgi:hypothetical protein